MPETTTETAPAAAASRAKVVETLMRLAKAVQKSTIYPEGHPAIPAAVATFLEGLRLAVEERPVLSLGIACDRILVDGEAIDLKNASVSWLAQCMYDRGIGHAELFRTMSEADGVQFVQWLSRPATSPQEGGPEDLPPFGGLVLTCYDYARVHFGEDPAADAKISNDPLRVWVALMSGLLGGDVSKEQVRSLEDPEALAREMCARIASTESENPAAVASRIIALSAHLTKLSGAVREAVKKKIGLFIAGLTPELRAELLRVDPHSSRQKLEFVTEIADALPDTMVLEILGNLDRSGAHVPHQFITLMNKLIGISSSGGPLQQQMGEKLEALGIPRGLMQSEPAKMREVLEEVLQSRAEKSWNPENYQALLEDLSRHRVIGSKIPLAERYGDPRDPEDVRAHVSRIVLRMLVAQPDVPESTGFMKCLDEDAPRAFESGRFEQVHEAATAVREISDSHGDLPEEFRGIAGAYLAGFSRKERVGRVLEAVMGQPGELPESLVGLFLIAGVESGAMALQRLADLADGPEREHLVQLLLRLEPENFSAAIARVRTEGWASIRALFPVLQRMGGTRAVEMALTFLGNEDPRIRIEAYRLLLTADPRPGQADRYLERAFGDESERVAAFALSQARARGGAGVVPLIGTFLRAGSRWDDQLRMRAIQVLAAFKTDQARDIMVEMLRGRRISFWAKQVLVTNALEEALTQIGDELSLAAVRAWRRSPARWLSQLLVQGKVEK